MSEKIISSNRAAYHNYFILDTYEAGIVLKGTEVKSAREGSVNLKEGYVLVRDGEIWLLNVHINQYSHGNRENHDPTRERRLLMHKREIVRLQSKIKEKGLTVRAPAPLTPGQRIRVVALNGLVLEVERSDRLV